MGAACGTAAGVGRDTQRLRMLMKPARFWPDAGGVASAGPLLGRASACGQRWDNVKQHSGAQGLAMVALGGQGSAMIRHRCRPRSQGLQHREHNHANRLGLAAACRSNGRPASRSLCNMGQTEYF